VTRCKAAGKKKPEAYHPFHLPISEPAETGSLPMGYVEDFFDPRTALMVSY
jgi:hypothetical protein